MFKNMGGLYSVNSNAKKGLMSKDKVHYSKQGYELQGELFFKALMEIYTNFKSVSSLLALFQIQDVFQNIFGDLSIDVIKNWFIYNPKQPLLFNSALFLGLFLIFSI